MPALLWLTDYELLPGDLDELLDIQTLSGQVLGAADGHLARLRFGAGADRSRDVTVRQHAHGSVAQGRGWFARHESIHDDAHGRHAEDDDVGRHRQGLRDDDENSRLASREHGLDGTCERQVCRHEGNGQADHHGAEKRNCAVRQVARQAKISRDSRCTHR